MTQYCEVCFRKIEEPKDHATFCPYWCENANDMPEFLNELFNQDEEPVE